MKALVPKTPAQRITPHVPRASVPLSFPQQRLWFLHQMGAGQAYHYAFGRRLVGALDHVALRRALDRIVARHEVLRTTFALVDEEPVQQIASADDSGFALVERDLRTHADPASELERLIAEQRRAPFDLYTGPLIRGLLAQLSGEEHVLLITMHHIVFDSSSVSVLIHELNALYAAYLDDGPDPLPALPIQYRDYAQWQRRWTDVAPLEEQADYWKTRLAGCPTLLELPLDAPRPAERDLAGAYSPLVLDEELTAKLRALGARHRTTLYTTLLAGWAALLARLSGQQDVVIGSPAGDRGRPELEPLIGFFVNMLSVRVAVGPGTRVSDLLAHVKSRMTEAQRHQDLPFEQVVELLQPERSLSHSPLFQVTFAWEKRWEKKGRRAAVPPGLTLEPLELPPVLMAEFDVMLLLRDEGARVVGGVEYATSLFTAATVERYLAYFRRFLEGMVAGDEQLVEALPILGDTERERLLHTWNATDTRPLAEQTIHGLVEAQATATPDAIAVVADGEALTYAALEARANRLARYLTARGVGPEVRVGLCLERSVDLVVALLGVLKAGGAYVPLDPEYPSERLAFMLADAQLTLVLTHERCRARVPAQTGSVVLSLDAAAAGLAAESPVPLPRAARASQLAYIIYTSGSTGRPKGAMNAHGALVNRLAWMQAAYGLGPDDVVLQKTPYSFDVSVWEFFWPLQQGATLVLARPHGQGDPEYLRAVIEQEQVTTLHFVPSMLAPFLSAVAPGQCASLRRVICSGEALLPGDVDALCARLPAATLHNLYGPTEAAVDVSAWPCTAGASVVPIGRPVWNTQLYVLDAAGGPAPIGVPGELYIGGVQVGRGYWLRSGLTAERFVPDAFGSRPGGRLYRTGDRARWRPDGTVEYLGRTDTQVKIRGFRIELGEIETQLRAHPGVRDAVVVARDDAPGERRLVAYATEAAETRPDAEALRAQLAGTLPDYMVPAAYVWLDALPVTPNGKLDRRALPAPAGDAYAVQTYAAPQGELERQLAEIWAEVLHVERVGRHDNFFHLGGHSLLAVRVATRVRRALEHELAIRDVFAYPVLADLAARLSATSAALPVPANGIPPGAAAITPAMLPLVALEQAEIDRIVAQVPGGAANVQDIYPLTSLQEGILFHHLLDEATDPYIQAFQFSCDSRARVDAYLRALQAVIDRHDILRTAVQWDGLPEPVQVVYRDAPVSVEEVSFDGSLDGDVAAQMYARFHPRRVRIDVRQAPLLRVYATYDAAHDRWLLLYLQQHLVVDHVTLDLVHAEIDAHLRGEAAQLPPPVPFRQLVAAARRSPAAAHEAFFRALLGDVTEPTAPFGLRDVHGDGSGIEQAHVTLAADVAARLRAAARRLRVSAASVCHVAWAQVLARVSGREDVVFGTVLTGRTHGGAGVEEVAGFLINTLPVRLDTGTTGAAASVHTMHTLLTQLLRHEQASLPLAQRCSAVPSPSPLFSAVLNYRHGTGARTTTPMHRLDGIRLLRGEERSNYPVALSIDDLGSGFGLTAQTPASIGPERVCGYMRTALASLVDALDAAPDTPLRQLAVLAEGEEQRLLHEWNATAAAYPAAECIHELFEAQVTRTPEAPAVVLDEAALGYGELNARANRLAHYLRARGVRPDTRVALCGERSVDVIMGLLAVLKAGGAYVPLDPAYPDDRLRFLLHDCAPALVLTPARLRARVSALHPTIPVVDLEGAHVWAEQPATNPEPAGLRPDHLAYVIYTSGSTGTPKGVMVAHRGLCNLAVVQGRDLALTAQSRVLQFASVSFDAHAWETLMALCQGASLHLVREQMLAGDMLLDTLAARGITHATLPPATLNELSDRPDLAALRCVVVAGDALPPAVANEWWRGRLFINAYGPTEATVCATMQVIAGESADSPPIGRPIANARVYILDGGGAPAPVGVAGELYLGGVGVARGYLQRPGLTAARFVPDPYGGARGARLYRTGDRGRWRADGTIDFLGRTDFQVKIRGFRIELGEIEARLTAYAGVREAVVVARGEADDKRLFAYYTSAAAAAPIDADDLRAHLAASVPEYMVPAAFVHVAALPLTPSGKVDRRALPAPSAAAYAARAYAAPEGAIETALAQIWAEVLQVGRVGRHDHFFHLGGHSLLAVRVVTRVRQRLDVEIALRDVFATPVLAALAERLRRAAPPRLPAITRAAGPPSRVPLSFAQQRLWFLAQLEGVSEAYHIAVAWRLTGALDRRALGWALAQLVARHEALRTTFVLEEDTPVQQIAAVEDSGCVLAEHDLRGHAAAEAALAQLIAEERRAPFDLQAGPLLRGRLVQLGDEAHALLLTLHHIVSDGWSMGVLGRELSALYAAAVQHAPDPLPPLAIQYGDYAQWQRQWLRGPQLQEQAAYWKTTLAGCPTVLDLPLEAPRPAQRDFAGAFSPLVLEPALTADLRRLSARHGTTLYMTLLAGWAALLARLAGQADVVIGSGVANRGRAEIEPLIGFFVNTLALRIDVAPGLRVRDLLAQVKDVTLAAQQHQDLPFEQVVELVQPVRSLAHSPLFQALLTWENVTEGTPVLPGLTVQPLRVPSRTAKFELMLSLAETGDRVVGGAEYATSLFTAATIARYLGYFRRLLAGMVADPAQPVDALPLLPAAEQRQLLATWNATATAPPRAHVHQLFEAQVAQTPDAIAVVDQTTTVSYALLNQRANQLAHYLRRAGVGPDTCVAICLQRSVDLVAALLAVLKAGGAYVPLDNEFPVERLNYILKDSGATVLLKDRDAPEALQVPSEVQVVDLALVATALGPSSSANLVKTVRPGSPAYVMYTSGSTGQPKGVVIPQEALANFLVSMKSRPGLSESDVFAAVTTVSFDIAALELYLPLLVGARIELLPRAIVADGKLLAARLRSCGATVLQATPATWRLLVESGWAGMSGLRAWCGGEDLPRQLADSVLERVAELWNLYGPTEATVWSTSVRIEPGPHAITIGRPIANTRIYLLNRDRQLIPPGVVGEIWIGGMGLALRYHNQPGLTSECFVPDPFAEPGARMYRTGDLGRWLPDGTIQCLGRSDAQVKIRGFRIELGEIETQLRAHPGVRDAVVVARDDAPGERRLVAYATAAVADTRPEAEALRAHLARTLPDYMVPAAYVWLDALPVTPNGKLDRRALPAPAGDAYAVQTYAAPQGELERQLAEIWAEVLHVERVGRHDNFFHLGGHSLLAVHVATRVRRALEHELAIRDVFAYPVLADLAARLGAAGAASAALPVPANGIPPGAAAITPAMLPLVALEQAEIDRIVAQVPGGAANVQDIYPLTSLQEGILFHHLLDEATDPYIQAFQFSCDSRARVDAYLRALQAVIDRHDILRTAVQWDGLPEPVQVVSRHAPLPVEEVAFDAAAGDVAAQMYARFHPRRVRIDVRQAPLLRVYATYDAAHDRWLLLYLQQHLVVDHVTLDLVHAEIDAHLRGEAAQLPPPVPFRQLVAAARRSPAAAHEAFFRALLGDVTEPTAPFGLRDVHGDGSGIEQAHVTLAADVAARLRAAARRLRVSAASVCHVAWAQVLARVSGREDVVFGTVLAGRTHGGAGADRVMGLFMNTLPVRLDTGTTGAAASVHTMHTLLTQLLRHEQASLPLAQRCSAVPSPSPLFCSALNYRHSAGAWRSAIERWEGIRLLRVDERTNYPVGLSVDDFGTGFVLTAQTPASIGPDRVCAYMRTALASLVDALDAAPDTPLRQLAVLAEGEEQRLLHEWNATAAAYPSAHGIHELFEAHVARAPDAPAVVLDDVTLSYGDLNRRANQLAHGLRAQGVQPETPVAVCATRGLDLVVGLLAVLKAGGTFVPLDPAHPDDRLRFLLHDCAPALVLTPARLRARVSALHPTIPVVDLEGAHVWAEQPATNPEPAGLRPDHLAYVIYTSGSTGTPKGVMVAHRGLCNLAVVQGRDLALTAQSRVLQLASVSFDGHISEALMALCQGASLHVMQREEPLAGDALLDTIAARGITHAAMPPAMLSELSDRSDLASLRCLVAVGDALPPAVANQWWRGRLFINGYGPTEGTIGATLQVISGDSAEAPPIGRPIANVRVYILDGHGMPAPVGVAGELYLGGVGVARGYLQRPGLTAARFVPDPYGGARGARLYRTGDRGRWRADGTIDFLGRTDFQVKIRGFRIELGEIEARLTAHAGVREAVVVARAEEAGEPRLVAYYIAADPGTALDGVELRAHVAATLPDHMVPAAFVHVAALPLTPSGKVDRRALPAPSAAAYAARAYAAPEGAIETALAQIWAEVLQVGRVGRHDHFFHLGGHSLLAVRVVTRVRQRLDVEIALRDVFATPVLAALAERLRRAAPPRLPAITRAAGPPSRVPLSFAQQRLWFLAQLEGVSEAYHIAVAWRLTGALDRRALGWALAQLVARHEALRTTFVLEEDTPVQQIAAVEDSGCVLAEHDLRGHAAAEAALAQLIAEERRAPFDLQAGPLLRGRLVQLGDEAHALLLTLHHIVSDGWSMGVLGRELSALYAAAVQHAPDPLPPLAIQYGDYAQWQRQWLRGPQLQEQAAYWKTTLAGCPTVLDLPLEAPRPAQRDFAGAFSPLVLEPALTADLRRLSARHGTTLYMTLLAGWAALLARLAGQADVVIGSGVANRGRAEIEPLIGFFVNTLALRIDVAPGLRVRDLLAQVKDVTLAAQQHQDLPFEQVVELVQPVRSLAHSPLFQALLTWENVTEGTPVLPGLTVQPLRVPSRTAKFELMLSLAETGDRVVGGAEYATSLFTAATIARYLGYFRRLLAGMVADPAQPVDALPLLPAAEQRQLLATWNATATAPPRAHVHQLFEAQVVKTPDAPAVILHADEMSYRELNRRANQLAHYLRERGVRPETRVALCVDRGIEMIVGLLGVLKAGGAYVPLDPAYPADRLRFMLRDCAPAIVLTQTHLRDRVASLDPTLALIDLQSRHCAGQPESNLTSDDVGLRPRHLAYVIYTSGSTGMPKGVMVHHEGVSNYLSWARDAYTPTNGSVVSSSLAFDATVTSLFVPLLCGGRIRVLPEETEIDGLVQALRSEHGLHKITPSYLDVLGQRLLAEGVQPSAGPFVIGGEQVSASTVRLWRQIQPDARLVNEYGPTETVVGCVVHEIANDVAESARIPIGRPIANMRIYILDGRGVPVPAGVRGELHIGGVGVARGYLNRRGLTAEKFVPDPYAGEAGARMYRTGDLGRWLPDGTIEFLGRTDHQVKIRGFRIELGEIEARLAAHAEVREAVVLARADATGDPTLVAYYTAANAGTPPDAEDLGTHLAATLPDYMLPSSYVCLGALPLTPNGKLDRQALPAPERIAAGSDVPLQGEVERELARIWAEVLKVERVGRHDNFFNLGGHSLLAVRMASRLRQSLNVELAIRDVFAYPVLADLAARLGVASAAPLVPANGIPPGCEAITPEMLPLVALTAEEIKRVVTHVPGGAPNIQDIYPLAPLQEGMLFHHLMDGGADPYVMGLQISFDSRHRIEDYARALQAVIDRHDILRTAVHWEGVHEPVQVVCRHAPVPVEETTLDELQQLYTDLRLRRVRIDVRRAPLLQLHAAYDPQNDHWLLVLLLHHLVVDHRTFEVMHGEIRAYLQGEESRLPQPLPFRNLVAQARHGVSQHDHETFFREMLADVAEPTAPFGLLDVHGDGSRSDEAYLALEPDLATRLHATARRLSVSAASLCHVAWAQVLARVSGREDVVFGTVLFGRTQAGEGAERVMGLFINTLPVRLDTGSERAESGVRTMHERLANLLRHEHASLALAQRCSAVRAPTPLFSALLNYRHSARPPGVSATHFWDGIRMLRGEERTNYPFTLSVDDGGTELGLTAQAPASVGPHRVCAYMRTALASLLDALESAPDTPLGHLAVLPEAEQRRLLYEWNATEAAYPAERCIHELFEAWAATSPDAPAVVLEDVELSYRELNRRANRLAHHLRELGVRPDVRVALCVERSVETIVGLLAVLKAGGAYVPLDPAYPDDRLRFMLHDCAPALVLTQAHLSARLSSLALALPSIEFDAEHTWGAQPDSNPDRAGMALHPGHLAYVIYTSGSTGTPKGVMVGHRGLCNLARVQARRFGVTADSRVLQFASVSFDAHVWETLMALCQGAALHLVRRDEMLAGDTLLDTLAVRAITHATLPPAVLSGLSERPNIEGLRFLVVAGDAVPSFVANQWWRSRLFVNAYGPTEATICATMQAISGESPAPPPIGRPIGNMRIYILDRGGAPVPEGVRGELHIGGVGVARGYLNRRGLTAEKFVPDPYGGEAGARLYRTGDLGRWRPDGAIDFLGRIDFQVKIRGYRIELGEIEARLATHAGVREAVVVVRDDGAGDKRLVAYYTAADAGLPLDAERLRAHLAATLPDYMVPAAYVPLDALPLTPTGKLDRKALPAPGTDAHAAQCYEPPQGETETALAQIWADVLKVERVGRHDDFFHLGGHSLLAMLVATRVREALDIEITVRDLFAYPIFSSLAERLVTLQLQQFASEDLLSLLESA